MGNKSSKSKYDKTLISNETINPNSKENLLIQKFKFPYAIKSDGGITYCFNDISPKDIIVQSRREFFFNKVESKENNSNIGNLEIENELQIELLLNDHKFKSQINNIREKTKKSNYFLGKYILYYIHIKPDNIKFSNHYKKRISDVLKYYYKDEERFKNLDEILQDIGFYIPLQIEIGAKFYTNADESFMKKSGSLYTQSNLDSDIFNEIKEKNKYNEINKNEYSNEMKREGQNIIGGNPCLKDLEKWKDSVNLDNAVVIGYKNLQHIKQFIDIKIRTEFTVPFQLIENKYKVRKLFMDNIEHLKQLPKKEFKDMSETYERGICKTSEIPKITVAKYEFCDSGHYLPVKNYTDFNKSFSTNIIVGWKIDSVWADGTNGSWSLTKDPLLNNDISCKFISRTWRGQRFKIFVYLMEIPD